MRELSMENVELLVKTIADTAVGNIGYFSELDSAAGDADFGVSLATGFQAVLDRWETLDRACIGSFLMKVGMVIISTVGGCSGPLWGTGFMRAGMSAKGKKALTLADLVTMLRSAMDGIMARGGAQLGDKTLLDALASATEALEEWSRNDPQDVVAALAAAASGATAAIESTRGWVAKRGRQCFLGERSRGTLDPGIVAVATMMQAGVAALKRIDS